MAAPVQNLNSMVKLTGEFSFAEGATSVASANALGWLDFGNITAVNISPTAEWVEHSSMVRGTIVKNKKAVKSTALEFGVKCDEFRQDIVNKILMGSNTTALSQAASSSSAGTALPNPVYAGRWYPLIKSGTHYREVSGVTLAVTSGGPTSCTMDASTDTITATAHGLNNGNIVQIAGVAVPGGLAASTNYYVIASTANTFKLATSMGGSAIDITSAGTTVTFTVSPTIDTDVFVCAKTGRIRFLSKYSFVITPTFTAAVINDGGTASLMGITPMDTPTRTGYGRILMFDATHPNNLVYDHIFQCQITVKGGGDMNAENYAEFDFTLTVLTDVGTAYVARDTTLTP